jgi:hypothetical protein
MNAKQVWQIGLGVLIISVIATHLYGSNQDLWEFFSRLELISGGIIVFFGTVWAITRLKYMKSPNGQVELSLTFQVCRILIGLAMLVLAAIVFLFIAISTADFI